MLTMRPHLRARMAGMAALQFSWITSATDCCAFAANFDQDLRPCPRPREKDIVADEVTELQGRRGRWQSTSE
jgi:hypothetical protein